jgi:hypothetical protein
MLPHDGRCSSGMEIASTNVKGVFLAYGTAKALRWFCTHCKKHFLSSKMWVPDWEFFGTGQKCHPTWTLNKLTWEVGGEKQSSDQKVLPGNYHRSGWNTERAGSQRVCLHNLTNQERLGCDITMGSLPLELGESWGSFCLSCFYDNMASQAGRTWRKYPCLV